jgi:hypothetical protein
MSALLAAENPDDEWLPNHCPSWCDGNDAHAVPLSEGCGWEDAQQHSASGPGEVLSEIRHAGRTCREFGGGWNMHLQQQPLPMGGYAGPPFVHVALDGPAAGERLTLQLTSGEARVLARQLVAMADRLDLP